MNKSPQEYLSVTQLNGLLNEALEGQFPEIRVEGELSGVKLPASGHIYAKLKDATAQIDIVMWRGTAAKLSFRPAEGMAVLAHGRPNIFKDRGALQIVVHQMFPMGAGLLQRKFLELKAKLDREGLFSPERKRAIPTFPKAVGVVTSGSGAVIHDIMVKIRERMPSMPVYLVDVRVQGEGAAQEIAEGIRQLNEFEGVDVIIVGRGGGSLEDLWAFNEEVVVRAIFASRIPVVSGVGHETDVTLADFVADERAPTPTAAAERVVPKRAELLRRTDELFSRISEYSRWLDPLSQRVDDAEARLSKRVEALFAEARLHLRNAESRLRLLEPQRLLEVMGARIMGLRDRLENGINRHLITRSGEVARLSSKLEALSPLGVLKRGYSLVERDGEIVRSVRGVKGGDMVKITLADGKVGAEILGNGKE